MQNPGQTFHTYVQDHSRIYMEKQGSRKLRVILKKESKIGRLTLISRLTIWLPQSRQCATDGGRHTCDQKGTENPKLPHEHAEF